MNSCKLLGPFTQLVTLNKLPAKGALHDSNIEIINDGALLLDGKTIYRTGNFNKLLKEARELRAEIVEFHRDSICLPGFIDSHTHICFAGSRARDFARRNAGMSYLEIAQMGGGIWDTVMQTRMASIRELTNLTTKRARKQIENGITTLEIKSGYGLSVEEELKILRAIQKAQQSLPIDLIPTCLAAHTHPRDFPGNRREYLKDLIENLFPILRSEALTNRIDAFVEKEAFAPDEIDPYFSKAKLLGFDLTVHADQFTPGGSELAVRHGALSADHLEASTTKEIDLLASSNTVATALPGASIGLGCDFAPARKILDRGGSLAIASDWNPGSAPMGDLIAQASILGTFEKLTNAEILSALTFRAAHALGLRDRGKLKPGMLADLVVYQETEFNEIFYNQGQLKPAQVWKEGQVIYQS